VLYEELVAITRHVTRSPGVVLGLLGADEPVAWTCSGTIGIGCDHPLTERTPIAAASVTKQMVGTVAAMVDAEQPGFSASMLSEWHLHGPAITLGQALSHNHGMSNPLWLYHGGVSREELGRRVCELPNPGVGFSYHDSVYALAGIALESLTGSSLDNLARRSLWIPAGMQRTALGAAHLVSRRDPEPVSRSSFALDNGEIADDPVLPDSGWTMDSIMGAGAMVTTCDDLASWARQILLAGHGARSTLHSALRSAMRQRVTTPRSSGPLELVGYGWGFRHFRSRTRRVVGHGGLYRGMATFVGVWPDDDIAVVGFANGRAGYDALFELADEVVGRRLGDTPRDPATVFDQSARVAQSGVETTLRRWAPPSACASAGTPLRAGTFRHPWLGQIAVESSEGEVWLRGPGPHISAVLLPTAEGTWFPLWNEALANYRPASLVVSDPSGNRIAWWDDERSTGWSAFERESENG
jgi:CubicO group peptidase (beta-lactamase class C family)